MHEYHMSTLGEARTASMRDEADRQRLADPIGSRPGRPASEPLRRTLRRSVDALLAHALLGREAR